MEQVLPTTCSLPTTYVPVTHLLTCSLQLHCLLTHSLTSVLTYLQDVSRLTLAVAEAERRAERSGAEAAASAAAAAAATKARGAAEKRAAAAEVASADAGAEGRAEAEAAAEAVRSLQT